MNNEELKKKIIEILEETEYEWTEEKKGYILQIFYDKLADALIAAGIGDVKDLQVQVDSLEITNIALQAGYDDAEKDRLYWVDKYKEAEHRAEVAEMALKKFAENITCEDCPFFSDCASSEKMEDLMHSNYCFAEYLKQAEKELAEEEKDD